MVVAAAARGFITAQSEMWSGNSRKGRPRYYIEVCIAAQNAVDFSAARQTKRKESKQTNVWYLDLRILHQNDQMHSHACSSTGVLLKQ